MAVVRACYAPPRPHRCGTAVVLLAARLAAWMYMSHRSIGQLRAFTAILDTISIPLR